VGGACSKYGKVRNVYKILVWKPEREKASRMDLREIGFIGYGLDASGLGWEPVTGSCEHCNKSSGFIKCREFLG